MSQDEKPEVPKKKEPINTPEKYVFGRPTKYTEDMPQKLLDYFNIPLYIEEVKETASAGRLVETTIKTPNKFPSFDQFAIDHMLSDSTIRLWKERYSDFSLSWEICKRIQKKFLMEHGLNGNYNSSFAKFVATNLTDLKDSTHHQVEAVKKIEINVDGEDSEI